jgi:hypothetical protein
MTESPLLSTCRVHVKNKIKDPKKHHIESQVGGIEFGKSRAIMKLNDTSLDLECLEADATLWGQKLTFAW